MMMLEHLIDDNYIDIDSSDVKFVQRLIKGDLPSENNEKRSVGLFSFSRVDV